MKFKSIANRLSIAFLGILVIIVAIIGVIIVNNYQLLRKQAISDLQGSVNVLNEIIQMEKDNALAIVRAYSSEMNFVKGLSKNDKSLVREDINKIYKSYTSSSGLSKLTLTDN